MTKNTFVKVFSVAALLVLLTPIAASAHGLGLNVGGGLHMGAGKDDTRHTFDHNGKDADKGDHDKNKDANKSATTSASMIIKASTRLHDWADMLASMSATISAKIAGSDLSASEKADANANLSDYNSNLEDAKSKASDAATVAAKVDASNSTTTNSSFVAEARTDLSAAWSFLKSAKQSLSDILHSLWGTK